jgi:hypothetical protein
VKDSCFFGIIHTQILIIVVYILVLEPTFNDYLVFLRENMGMLSAYWQAIGNPDPYIAHISKALEHPDPFVIYHASIAATALLNDKVIYH